ncbi:MAG: HAD family hydrolase [Clostridia bacterium]|nr:HAD family hydrolase [Clostridia bacterium]
MRVDGIIFDKDGTLMSFDAFWVSLSVKALEDVLGQLGMEVGLVDEILVAFGVRDGVTDINGVLCKGTYAEMGEIVFDILAAHGCTADREDVVKLVEEAYSRNAAAGDVKPTCPDLAAALAELKGRGLRLAVVTTDNEPITRHCLTGLGILEYFDVIFTDDGHTPTKPDPFCAGEFCRMYGLDRSRVMMVGDTMTDVRFAKNGGITAVSLAPTPEKKALLAPHTDIIIDAISELTELIK